MLSMVNLSLLQGEMPEASSPILVTRALPPELDAIRKDVLSGITDMRTSLNEIEAAAAKKG